MKQRYSYRIYPTQQQQVILTKLYGCCRVVWNDALAWTASTPDNQKWPSNVELQKLCITLAKQYPQRSWLSEVPTVPLQQSLADLGTAFTNFFEKRAKFPKFKKKSGSQSARFTRPAIRWQGDKLVLAGVGAIKVKWSRTLPSEPSSVTVTRNKVGQYHASFVVEVEPVKAGEGSPSIGVDLGLKTFAFCSDGSRYVSPSYKRLNRRIARLQRRLSRQKRGSNRRERTRLQIAKLKLKIRNIRKDFLHKLSTKLVLENQVVSIETLNVKGMVKNRRLSRAISEQGWGEFGRMCEAKVSHIEDRQVVKISQWEPTSQTCSACGYRWGKIDLSVRSILCLGCGTLHDRDGNASKNIEKSGLELAHDSKWTVNACQPGMSSSANAPSSQPCEEKQLSLCL